MTLKKTTPLVPPAIPFSPPRFCLPVSPPGSAPWFWCSNTAHLVLPHGFTPQVLQLVLISQYCPLGSTLWFYSPLNLPLWFSPKFYSWFYPLTLPPWLYLHATDVLSLQILHHLLHRLLHSSLLRLGHLFADQDHQLRPLDQHREETQNRATRTSDLELILQINTRAPFCSDQCWSSHWRPVGWRVWVILLREWSAGWPSFTGVDAHGRWAHTPLPPPCNVTSCSRLQRVGSLSRFFWVNQGGRLPYVYGPESRFFVTRRKPLWKFNFS